MPSSSETPALALEGVSKRFGGVQALAGACLELHAGRVTALVGENGAGKSTAVKIMTGVYRPDAGTLRVGGAPVALASARQAWERGVAAVYQEPALFDELSVAENIFAGHLLSAGAAGKRSAAGRGGFLNWAEMRRRAAESLASLELRLDVDAPLGALSLAQKHRVAIARALTHDARVLILDEPTAALSSREVEDLYRIIRRVAGAGTAILFISHKLDEVFAIAERYAVFRDGRDVASGPIGEVNEAALVRAMVGRSITRVFPKAPAAIGRAVLEVRELGNDSDFEGISFTLHAGEVLGFYGLVGSGRTELVEALFGLSPPTRGTALLDAQPIARSARESIERGLVLIPEDRQRHGVFGALSIRDNLALPSLRRLGRGPLADAAAEGALARQVAERLAIKHASLDQRVNELSGGNQQKVVLGKWLATEPRIIILDEPTQGIDVAAKAAVHAAIGELVQRGVAVILVSSELAEVMGVADRIAVMREGQLEAIVPRAEFDARAIVAMALGASAVSKERADAEAARAS